TIYIESEAKRLRGPLEFVYGRPYLFSRCRSPQSGEIVARCKEQPKAWRNVGKSTLQACNPAAPHAVPRKTDNRIPRRQQQYTPRALPSSVITPYKGPSAVLYPDRSRSFLFGSRPDIRVPAAHRRPAPPAHPAGRG